METGQCIAQRLLGDLFQPLLPPPVSQQQERGADDAQFAHQIRVAAGIDEAVVEAVMGAAELLQQVANGSPLYRVVRHEYPDLHGTGEGGKNLQALFMELVVLSGTPVPGALVVVGQHQCECQNRRQQQVEESVAERHCPPPSRHTL